ncbi:glucose oxidase [Pestalotiopsis sp. NC0098]|nr:glucose oxidase [Pestalotiopsis sp. NC0098]
MPPLLLWTLLLLGARARCETFDYVIAGGGTAGMVLANRLSEDPGVRVAVVEAGADARAYPNVTRIDLDGLNYINASVDWAYTSVPQPGIGNRSLLYHAGKALGGTSNINGMVYLRGDEAQFDAWETLGNEGWNWRTLLEYYKRSENFTIPSAAQTAAGVTFEEQFHGRDGFLTTGMPNGLDNSTFPADYLRAWNELGVPHNADPEGGVTEGFAIHPQTLDRDAGVRETAARAYYTPVEGRSNLKIIQGTVSRLVWADTYGEGIVASGVEYLDTSGVLSTVTVAKEVIVSAGTLRCPLVLEASGIGNPSILSSYGIDVQVDLPGVGEGMSDQQLVGLVYDTSENIPGFHPFVTFVNAQDLFGNETASTAESTAAKIATWAQAVSESSNGALGPEALEARFQLQHDLIFQANVSVVEVMPYISAGTIASVVWVLMPFSWGSVHLSTPSAADAPLVDPRYIAVDFDVDVLAAAGRLSQRLYDAAPVARWVAGPRDPGGVPAPGATDDVWRDFILDTVGTAYHEIGTCAMLPRELGGVVDSKLKVYGTRNVRVVDASALPLQMSGNPSGTVYAFAERAADIIKAGCDEEA